MTTARVLTSTRTTHLDHSTGEVLSTEDVIVARIPKEPAYVKMYIEDLSRIVGLSAGAQSVLYELAGKIDYEGRIMRKSGYCEYEMNPNLFAKGDWQDVYKRRQAFKLEIKYSDGKRIINGHSVD